MPDTSGTTSKRGKKRARGFDGDEAFRVDTVVLCADHLDEEVVLVSLNGGYFQIMETTLFFSLCFMLSSRAFITQPTY